MQTKDIPEGRGSLPAGALEGGSPLDVARDATPGSAVPGGVVHCARDSYDVYVGRKGSGYMGQFGNPFVMRKESDREKVIGKFEEYARARIEREPAFRDAVKALYGKTLGCWCAPKACHGDVLLKLAAELHVTVGGRADK